MVENRRLFLQLLGAAGVTSIAGCSGGSRVEETETSPSATEAEISGATTTTEVTSTKRVEGTWEMYGNGPHQSGYARDERGPVESPTVFWEKEVGEDPRVSRSGLPGEPAIRDGTLYLGGSRGTVYALDATTGNTRWTSQKNFYIQSSVAIGDEQLFVGGGDNMVHAFDLEDGDENWERDFDSSIDSSLVLADDTLLAYPVFSGLLALNPEDGAVRWEVDGGGITPTVADGVVVVPADDTVFGVDIRSGETVRSVTPTDADLHTTPIVGDRRFYVGDESGGVFAVGLDSWETEWEATLTQPAGSVPVVAETLVVADTEGTLYGFDPEDGTERWSFDVGGDVSGMCVGGDVLYVGARRESDGVVYALDVNTGGRAWEMELDQPVTNSPVVVDGVLYVGDEKGSLVALVDESEQDAYPTPRPTTTTPGEFVSDGDSGGDGGGDAGGTTGTSTETTDPTEDADHVVEVGPNGKSAYRPSSLTVNLGDTVVWVWKSDTHNIRMSTLSDEWEGTPGGENDFYDEGTTHSHTFGRTGTFNYYCGRHNGMTGSITVE